MQKFEQEFEIKNIKNLKEKKEFDINSYANFCMNYVNSLKKVLEFEEKEYDNKKYYCLNIPTIKIKRIHDNSNRGFDRVPQKGGI